jgi:hypothetical protein
VLQDGPGDSVAGARLGADLRLRRGGGRRDVSERTGARGRVGHGLWSSEMHNTIVR